MFRLYLRRWRVVILALVVGTGSAVGVALAVGPPAAGAHTTQHVRAAGQVTSQQSWHVARSAEGGQSRRGLLLLALAAAACRDLVYQGLQLVTWTSQGDESRYLISLWHRPGSPAITQDISASDGAAGGDGNLVAPVSDADALFLSPVMVSLIQTNFTVEYGGEGSVDGRPSEIVVLLGSDGDAAARIWVDQRTDLPLRRQIYDGSGRLINDDEFIDLEVGSRVLGQPPTVAAAPPGDAMTGAGISALRRAGWPVPRRLDSGLAMVAATKSVSRAGQVVDVSYSDGLSVISVFLQRGGLPATLPGWEPTVLAGYPVFAGQPPQRSFAWSARGFVYTVVANAPPATVRLAVAALPHDRVPGFFDRVRRGLKRIVSWVDPFG